MIRIHSKAWQDTEFLILGKTPIQPMKIEQQIAAADPNIEVLLNSYEDYNQAYRKFSG